MTTSSEGSDDTEAEVIRAARIVESVVGNGWATDASGRFSYVTPTMLAHLGLTLQKLNSSNEGGHHGWKQVIHPDDYDAVAAAWRHSLQTGDHYNIEHRMLRATGVFDWARCSGQPCRTHDGRIVGWYGAVILPDLDNVVGMQGLLRERERELSQIVDMVPSHVWRLTPEGEPTFFNQRMVDFLGFSVSELDTSGTSRLQALVEAVHPDDAALFRKALHQSLATGENFAIQYRLRRFDGAYRWMSSRAEPLRDENGNIVQWFGLCHDIDDQMRLYGDIAEREARIRRLVESDIIGIVIWDLDGTLIDANDAFLSMIQYDRDDLKAGIRWFDITPPEWQAIHEQEEAAELAATGKMQAREKEYFRKDGSRVPVLIGAACFDGQSRQGVAYILDLTELKRAETALREREGFLWQLVETLPAMIDCTTPDGESVYRSQQLREFLGYGPENPNDGGSRLSATFDASVHPDDLANVKNDYAHSIATGAPFARRHRLRRFDGEYHWVETRAAPMRDAEGAIVQWNVVCLDIDGEVRAHEDLRLSQERLIRASQTASLAELSASIAHEINQPLAAVVAHSHACQRWLTADPPNLDRAQSTVQRITRDANAAADVVSRVRALFRHVPDARVVSSISDLISETHDLMADELRKAEVMLVGEIEPGLPPIALDRIQVQQVLVNLVRNAVEAMEALSGPRVAIVRANRSGGIITIQIVDQGSGLKAPDKIFEPFFTTKQSGMGMGLAICRSIVEAHGGRLWAERNLKKGTTFLFTLPIEKIE